MLKIWTLVAASSAFGGCVSKLTPDTANGGQTAATSTATTSENDGSTSVGTAVLQIPAIDLDGLKTVTIDVGPLKGFTVQAPNGIDPSTEIKASITPDATFPLEVDGNVKLVARIRIGLPDALLKDIDLSHPETIAVYARQKDGQIVQLPSEDVSVEPPKLYVVIGDYLSLVVVQSRPALAITTPSVDQAGGAPSVAWKAAPIGTDPTYELRVFEAACKKQLQSQETKAVSVAIAPPLAPGDYCVKVYAKVGAGVLEQAGAPLVVHIQPPAGGTTDGGGGTTGGTSGGTSGDGGGSTIPEFTFSAPSGQTNGSATPTITWNNAPRLADGTVTYDIKICADSNCNAVQSQGTGLSVATYTPGSALADGTHYVSLTAKNGAGESLKATGSDTFVLKTDSTPPGSFQISGSSGQATASATPTITWGVASDASTVTYAIKLAATSNCASPAAQGNGLSAATFSPSSALSDGVYYVCLTATDAAGHSTDAGGSGSWTIQVDTQVPSNFAINSPPTNTGLPTITWSASSDATAVKYDFKLFQSNCSTQVEQQLDLAATQATVSTQLLTAHSYCIKVLAKDAVAHTKQPANDSYAFTVNVSKPSDASGGNGTGGSGSVSLTWAGAGGATGYLVVRHQASAVTFSPADGTAYSNGSTVGSDTIVTHATGTSYTDTGLNASTTYHYAIFAYNAALAYAANAATASATTGGAAPKPTIFLSMYDGANAKILKNLNGSFSELYTTSASNETLLSFGIDAANALHLAETASQPDIVSTSYYMGASWTGAFDALLMNGAGSLAVAVDSTTKTHGAINRGADLVYSAGIDGGLWSSAQVIRTNPGGAPGSTALSIALDRRDVPHVVFMQKDTGGGYNTVFYANRSGGTWTVTNASTLSKTAAGPDCMSRSDQPRFALDANGTAHVVYHCDGNVVYATNKTGTWTYSTVAGGSYPDIAVTDAGLPAVAYFTSGGNAVKTFDGTSWSLASTVVGATYSGAPRIAYDANGNLHVVTLRLDNSLEHYTNSSGSWVLDGAYAPLAIPSLGGNLVIKGMRGNGNFTKYAPELATTFVDTGIKTYTKPSTTWSQVNNTTGFSDGNLVYGKDHWLRVGYMNLTGNKNLYVTNSGGSWGTGVEVQAVSTIVGNAVSIDSNNLVHAFYADGADVFLRKETAPGSFSLPDTIRDSNVATNAASLDLAIDGNDKDHMVYLSPEDMTTSPIYYTENTSGSYSTTGPTTLNKNPGGGSNCGSQATSPRIAVTRAGKAYITYNCTQQTVVATNIGGSWAYYGLGYNGVINRAAIALDKDENPYVAIRTAGNAITIKWGSSFTNSWSVALGTATGTDPALAVDDMNTIHVIWQDDNYLLKHSWRHANGDQGSETIYSASNNVTLFRSLGIDGAHGSANH